MTWFAEDPLPIWLAGALALTMALIVYLQLRTRWSLGLVAGVIGVVALLIWVEQLIVTPREAVNQALLDVLAAVEANDLPATLDLIASSATTVQSDARTIMPRVDIRRASVADTPKIVFSSNTKATVTFKAILDAAESRSGMKGGFFDDVEVQFAREGDRWLVTGYQPSREWQGRVKRLAAPNATPINE